MLKILYYSMSELLTLQMTSYRSLLSTLICGVNNYIDIGINNCFNLDQFSVKDFKRINFLIEPTNSIINN